MLLTPWLCASPVLILSTLVSLLLRYSFQTIIPFGWGRVPMFELLLFLVLDLILSISVDPSCIECLIFMHFVHLTFLDMHCFVFYLNFMFLFCVSKNPKPHKKWKIQKVWSYMFEHISHVSFALYLRTNGFVHLWA